MSSTSAPASSARTAASPVEKVLTMPAISSASVTMMPLKPSSFFNRSVRIAEESVEGIPGGESAGTAMCAVITESTPAAMAALNGTSSTLSRRSRSTVIVGMFMWLSTAVSPCPGKCFTVANA